MSSSHQKTLYLARHAKSSWDSNAENDFDRPLSKRGLNDASKMGLMLNEKSWKPQQVFSSPAKRAKQTCCILCENIGFSIEHIVWEENIYAAYTVTLLHILNALPEIKQSIMLVGHNPAMEDLLIYFCGNDTWDNFEQTNGKLFTTGNVAKLSFNGSWRSLAMGNAELVQLLRPKKLF